MKAYSGRDGTTRSFHRPLEIYVNGLAAQGLLIEQMREIPTLLRSAQGPRASAEHLADQEIPLFLGLRAIARS